ncbi:sugar transferase [Microlunatus sp. Y2014]|uniref:sugar transferase n=1 Tax=Microlunatus sp. Y2014 TaxID=3418488 RepID=UPI003DA74C92
MAIRPTGFQRWSLRYVVSLCLHDAWVGALSMMVAGLALGSLVERGWSGVAAVLTGAAVWPLAVATAHGYERRLVGVGADEIRAVFRAAISVLVGVAIVAAVLHPAGMVETTVGATAVATGLSLFVRHQTRKSLHRRQAAGEQTRRTLLVGCADTVAQLAATLDREPHLGMSVVGVCVPHGEVAEARQRGLTVVGDISHIRAALDEFECDAVAVSGSAQPRPAFLRELAWSLEGTGVELFVHPGLVEVAGPRMHIRPHVGLPLLQVEQPHFRGWRRLVKRGTDVLLTGFGLLLIAPLLAVIAVVIKLGDGGPVLFRQTRVGAAGSTFTMLKFRSMRVDAEQRLAALQQHNEGAGVLFKMKDDPRVTPVGRFLRRYSLDELPQLFNVLAGTMSLVGPRPPLPSEVSQYGNDVRRRLLVTPGLTGLWQVSGRSSLSWEESVRLDLRYVENWTLSFDLLIMWKTVFAVLAQRGAY